ncbi:MAG: carboxypeptidase regulatory-like domain-containing protein [Pedosphaera sp.]|nr:carboxypeptidase regulatory-like domain-containing protein [Pedosphaera sp.]
MTTQTTIRRHPNGGPGRGLYFRAFWILASRIRRGFVAATRMATVSILLQPAHGFVTRDDAGIPVRWNFNSLGEDSPDQNPQTLAIRFRLGRQGSGHGDTAAELAAVRASFGQWQAVPGTRIRFEDAGLVDNTSVVVNDTRNTVTWASASSPYLNSGASARTTVVTVGADLVEADIVINSDKPWFTDYNHPQANILFLEAVVTHEIGHLLGLLHSLLGGATMFWMVQAGLNSAAGLSADEINFSRSIYGAAATATAVGTAKGRVLKVGKAVFGAMVFAEDAHGVVQAGTISNEQGQYQMPGLPPGAYQVRALSLDPRGASFDDFLVRGFDLDEFGTVDNSDQLKRRFEAVATDYGTSPSTSITVTGGKVTSLDLTVPAGAPPFRITEMRTSLDRSRFVSGDGAVQVSPGQQGAWIGVYVPGLPTGAVELEVGGDGLTRGGVEVIPNALRSMSLVQAEFSVALGASPGLRTISVKAGGITVRAHGFLEVLPPFPDFNFDGFDDRFQRRYFNPFTVPEAAPGADPDGDHWTNARESSAGSDPLDGASTGLRVTILGQQVTATTAAVTCETAPAARYQLFRRADLAGAAWQSVGAAVTAVGNSTVLLDTNTGGAFQFYRVKQLP